MKSTRPPVLAELGHPMPVFLICPPHSGAAELAEALAQHRELWNAGESHVLGRLLADGRLSSGHEKEMGRPDGTSRRHAVGLDELLRHLGAGFDALMSGRSQGRRWIAWIPAQEGVLDDLALMFPGARFVRILRDGREVVASMTAGAGGDPSTPPVDFVTACLAWRDAVEVGGRFARANPGRCLSVHAEDLASDPSGTLGVLLRFLGVPPDECCAAHLKARRVGLLAPGGSGQESRRGWEAWSTLDKMRFLRFAAHTLCQLGRVRREEFGDWQAEVRLHLVPRVQAAVAATIPEGAAITVVSDGVDAFLRHGVREACHFPCHPDGSVSPVLPPSGDRAVAHLQEHVAKGSMYLVLPNTGFWWLEHFPELARFLGTQAQRLFDGEDCIIFGLRKAASGLRGGSAAPLGIVEALGQVVPSGERIAVVCKGEDALVHAGTWSATPFPADAQGRFRGYNPVDSREAMALLDQARSLGVRFLVFPANYFWWLDHYDDFRRQLHSRCRRTHVAAGAYTVFSLSDPPSQGSAGWDEVAEPAAVQAVLRNPPQLHTDVHGNLISWGLGNDVLEYLAHVVRPGWKTLETGAGLSTVMFAITGSHHTCVMPDPAGAARIRDYCEAKGIPSGRVAFELHRSQDRLPHLALSDLDLVLIDGGHGFPIPFADWMYTAVALKVGGLLIVDDTQLWTGSVLQEFLSEQPGWEVEREFGKTVVFRRTKPGPILGEWNTQPFVLRRCRPLR